MPKEIKHYFEILEQIVADEQLLAKQCDHQTTRANLLNRVTHYLMVIGTTLLIAAMAIWVMANTFRSLNGLSSLADLAFTLFFLVYCLLLATVFFRKSSGLATMRVGGEADSKYLSALKSLSYETLALGCLELEHGRDWFTRGIASLVGVIEKVGLIPSILSLIALFAIPDRLPTWASPLISLSILLYSTSFVLQERIIRFDRLLALTKLALALKNK